ncbi:MAG: TlpA family protein disulfide reductase [Anaerolineales bacterium]|nr:TlpA family protein disulfide reductase [Anaerolineales bacterium]MCB9128631.1 TlpA family protein disulfide reductase [Ardenticatenales bacterium]
MTVQTSSLDQSPTRPSPGRPWWTVPIIVAVVALLALMAYGMFAADRTQLVDGPVPDLTLTTYDGEQIALRELEGTPIVLNFWASWCRECDKEMGWLQAASEDHAGELFVLGVAHVDTERAAVAYLEKYGITYQSGPDLGGQFADVFRIKGVPETFFIDREGVIRGMHLGTLEKADLDDWIAQLLAEPTAAQ